MKEVNNYCLRIRTANCTHNALKKKNILTKIFCTRLFCVLYLSVPNITYTKASNTSLNG